jgi:hypothetical protein
MRVSNWVRPAGADVKIESKLAEQFPAIVYGSIFNINRFFIKNGCAT